MGDRIIVEVPDGGLSIEQWLTYRFGRKEWPLTGSLVEYVPEPIIQHQNTTIHFREDAPYLLWGRKFIQIDVPERFGNWQTKDIDALCQYVENFNNGEHVIQ